MQKGCSRADVWFDDGRNPEEEKMVTCDTSAGLSATQWLLGHLLCFLLNRVETQSLYDNGRPLTVVKMSKNGRLVICAGRGDTAGCAAQKARNAEDIAD